MKFMRFFILSLLAISVISSCASCKTNNNSVTQMPVSDPYRPQYHFTPPRGWMNDPNGLVFYQGEYHLFYQHNPADDVWGPMHWGHAVNTDLVNWQHHPIALFPDENGTIFSGSAVVDWENTAGFGKEAMVAIFTHDHPDGQSQSLAYSNDHGRTWIKYPGNPVLTSSDSRRDFRDPKVFWFDKPTGGGHWAMVLAAGNEVLFYNSPDLIHWEPTGKFGAEYKEPQGVWETPDLFKLMINGAGETHWVLTIGTLGENAIAGGTGMRYFVGEFDGSTFSTDNPDDLILWVDYGADFYAAQSWSDLPSNRRIWIGWLNNWQYAQKTPADGWRGVFTIPRELSLVDTPAGLRLAQHPVDTLISLRSKQSTWTDQVISEENSLLVSEVGLSYEISAEFVPDLSIDPGQFGIHLFSGKDEKTTIGFNPSTGAFFINRLDSGQTDFHAGFGNIHIARIQLPPPEIIDFHIFVDRSSIEVFANDGQIVFSEQIFPTSTDSMIEVFSEDGSIQLKALSIHTLELK